MILEIDQSKSIVENPRKDAPAYHKNMTEKMVKIYPQKLWQTIELDTMAMISYLFSLRQDDSIIGSFDDHNMTYGTGHLATL